MNNKIIELNQNEINDVVGGCISTLLKYSLGIAVIVLGTAYLIKEYNRCEELSEDFHDFAKPHVDKIIGAFFAFVLTVAHKHSSIPKKNKVT